MPMSGKDQLRRRTHLCGAESNPKSFFFPVTQSTNNNMVMISSNEKINNKNMDKLHQDDNIRLALFEGKMEPGIPLRRGSSLNFKRKSQKHLTTDKHFHVPRNTIDIPSYHNKNNDNEINYKTSSPLSTFSTSSSSLSSRKRDNTNSAPAYLAPAPEYLAISLLQLGCPLISMPRPRGGVGLEHLPPQSSDSDDSTTSHHHHHHYQQQQQQQQQQQHHHHHHHHHHHQQEQEPQEQQQHQQQTSSQSSVETYALPKVQVSAPISPESPSSNESVGSIDARSAPPTPKYQISPTIECGQQSQHEKQQSQQPATSGTQLNVTTNSSNLPPSKSPSHINFQKCNDSHLSKPLSRSTPSMTASAGISQTPLSNSRTSIRSSTTSTSNARQKKFHRHFSQVPQDERVLNYYSCALVGNMLLQGHLYITPNYFAFYSNVFGYITKLLIPTKSVLKISKEKTARIIPNAIAIVTKDERHVFGSLLSRDSTFKLMKQVWDVAMEGREADENLPSPVDVKLLAQDTLLGDDLEVNAEEDDSSMSESGTDLSSRPQTICTDTDGMTPSISRPSLSSPRLEHIMSPKMNKFGLFGSLLKCQIKPSTVIAILIALLAALYISAALMMIRIDKLHTAYLNHPFSSPERFTQNRLLQYLNTNLDQIGKVRQSLQTLSQQFVAISEENEARHSVPSSSGTLEPGDAPR